MKILCSDYDGTLLQNKQINPEVIEAIKKFRALGNKFGIVTGRGLNSIVNETQKYGIPYDFLVCNNGGAVFDKELNTIALELIDYNEALKVIELLKKSGCKAISANDGSKRAIINFCESDQIIKEVDLTWDELLSKKKIGQIVGFVDDHTKAIEITQIGNHQFEDLQFYANLHCIDVVKNGCSKASGIDKVLKYYHYSEKKVYCIGDALNDLTMLEKYHGYGIKHGVDKIFSCCDGVVSDVKELINLIEEVDA